MRGCQVAAVVAAALALTGGCASQPRWSDASLCRFDKAWQAKVSDPEAWIRLLVRGYDPDTRRVTYPAVDCTGAQVRWDAPALSCKDSLSAQTPLPERQLTAHDVVVSPVTENVQIVWVMTTRFASGDALGPVAVVESEPRALVVRAIGPLRANPEQVRLRLERIGELRVAVAQGDQCATRDPSSCQRAARLVPLRGDRFIAEALVDDEGTCLAPALVDITRQDAVRLETGWHRRFTLEAALLFGPAGLTIQEQIAVHDLDPRQASAPPRLFRRAESERYVKVVNGRLVSSGAPLWGRMVEATRVQ